MANCIAVREKVVSWVLAGGLIGAVVGPNLAAWTRTLFAVPYLGAYVALSVAALLGLGLMQGIDFPDTQQPKTVIPPAPGRSLSEIAKQPEFLVAVIGAALGYGVMNLLMAAMQVCGYPFSDTALVLEWHVIGMFAPGFFTGSLIKRFGALAIMGVGVLLNALCIVIALMGTDLHQFVSALFLLGVGWNFLFTASTTLAMNTYRPEEKDKTQAAINFWVFMTMALTSFSSGALVTTQGWRWLNLGSLIPVALTGVALLWLAAARPKT